MHMSQDSDPGVISQTLYHQLKRPREGQRKGYIQSQREKTEMEIELLGNFCVLPGEEKGAWIRVSTVEEGKHKQTRSLFRK